MIYHDLADSKIRDIGMLTASDTGWQVMSAAVLESEDEYPDTTFIEGLFLSDTHCADGASQFDTTNTRAYVAYGTVRGREDCVEIDPEHAVTIFYRNQFCRNGRTDYQEFAPHRPSAWQPRCMVLLIRPESRAALRDELIEAGRPLTKPARVLVLYTTATSDEPDLAVSSANCAVGRELQLLHEHDLVGQADADLLIRLQEELAKAIGARNSLSNFLDGLCASCFPPPPPSPPIPPPAGDNAPPAAPAFKSFEEQLVEWDDLVVDLQQQLEAARETTTVCVQSATTTCGRTSRQAPNPWLSATGEKCIGHDTMEGFEGAFCAYWQSDVCCFLNPRTAESTC